MTARDLARFGLLFLRQGRWQETQVIPAAWVSESTASHFETRSGQRLWLHVVDRSAPGFFPM